MKIKDLILKTEKVNWQELKDLQPTNLKNPYHSNLTKESLIKNSFAQAFYVWENKSNKYIIDGHLRTDLLKELISEGHDIPNQLSCTFLDLPNRKAAIKYLFEVFNTKKNPIDLTAMNDWIISENIEDNQINVGWVDIVGEIKNENYSNKNKEIKLDDLGNESNLIFKFDHKTYLNILALLNNAREQTGSDTNEDTLLKLLEKYA